MGPHTVLAGRYELVSPLGRGGMGQVWEAEDQRLNRTVAVKVLTDDALAGHTDPDELARRFAREAAVTAGLRTPGVPAVYDVGTYEGGLFLVLELITGRTLGDLMAEEGPLPVAWAAGIAAQVTAVLAAAHEGGLVHRDVKPQNLMLTGDGAVKVLDFGVAALVDQSTISRITRTGQPIGTLAYMAPEQLHGRPVTARTDLYALGCVLYEMLAGHRVFTAGSPAALMHLLLEQAPAPLHRDDLPEELNALLRQLLEKDPARRPADAQRTYDRLMPHVAPPGPLGDIDLTAGRQSGTHLYSRALARLTAPHDRPPMAAPRPTFTDQPVPVSWPAAADSRGAASHGAASHGAASHGAQPVVGSPWQPGGVSVMGAPNSGGPPPAYPPQPMSGWSDPRMAAGPPTVNAPHGYGWKVLHSLWMLPTLLFGIGTWLSFAYIGARHRRPSWFVAAAVYLVLAVAAFALIGSAPENKDTIASDTGMVLWLLSWPAGIIHALGVNFATRLPLRARRDRPA